MRTCWRAGQDPIADPLKRLERRAEVVWRNLSTFGALPPDVAVEVARLVKRSGRRPR